jgi:hypothetical protein
MARMTDVGRAENGLGKPSYRKDAPPAGELEREGEPGCHFAAPRESIRSLGAGMRRDDIPEQDVLLEPKLRENAVDDRRAGLGRPAAGELPLRRERDSRDARAPVTGGFANEQQRSVFARAEVRGEALATGLRPVAVAIEVECLADDCFREP